MVTAVVVLACFAAAQRSRVDRRPGVVSGTLAPPLSPATTTEVV